MRGDDFQNHTLFSYVRPDSRIPANHPLRLIRQVWTPRCDRYQTVRPWSTLRVAASIAPERLLRRVGA